MAVATLPIIGTPSHVFFQLLNYLPLGVLVLVLTVWQVYIIGWQVYILLPTLGQRVWGKKQGAICLTNKFITFVGNNVCVILFPNLFKKHKQCRGSKERTFILFLDRDIENLKLKGAFYSLDFSILLASALVFFFASFQWLSVESALKRMLFSVLYSVTQTRATFQSTVLNLPTTQ